MPWQRGDPISRSLPTSTDIPQATHVTPQDRIAARTARNMHAALLIDIDDLVRLMQGRGFVTPARVMRGLLQRLFSYLKHRGVESVTRVIAVGDFDRAGDGVQRTLVLNGIDPVHVPQLEGTPSLGAMQLGIEATALAHSTPDVSTVVLAVGKLLYLPLVQQLQRAGLRVVIVWDRDQVPGDLVLNVGRDAVVGLFEPTFNGPRREEASTFKRSAPTRQHKQVAHNDEDEVAVLEEEADDGFAIETIEPDQPLADGGEDLGDLAVGPPVGDPVSGDHELMALRTLIMNFGRHAEVFLTPYLFKLNAVLPDLERFERKAVVMRLEEAGAVKIERRRGIPNDYSVIIVNYNHPTVREMAG